MKRIAVDMDGVLADVYRHFITWHQADFGETLLLENLGGKTEDEAFPRLRVHVNTPGFFATVPLITGCQQVLQQLQSHYEVFIVSAATEFPLSLPEKQSWMKEYFPFISWQHLVFCGSKQIVKADIMIDDHFKNLDYFEGRTLLFTQPHNQLASPGRHERVFSWEEIARLLLPAVKSRAPDYLINPLDGPTGASPISFTR